MTYDRAAIMTAAWAEVRYKLDAVGYARRQIPALLSRALCVAWHKAKEAARLAALSVAQLRAIVIGLENTDYLGWEGQERLSAMQRALRAAEAREAAEREAADLDAKRALIHWPTRG